MNNYYWYILFISLNILLISLLLYQYYLGSKGNINYQPIYNFFKNPNYTNFKIWFASILNNPLLEILLIGIILMIPFPFFPEHPHNRIELLFAKLGLYYIVALTIIGKPNFDAKQIENSSSYTLGWIIFVLLMVIFLASKINWSDNFQEFIKSICINSYGCKLQKI